MERPTARMLADGRRLHLNHGPIDLIIEAFGGERSRAYNQAIERFQTVLEVLSRELETLRKPTQAGTQFECAIANRMQKATSRLLPHFSTPMAAVAGAVADELLDALCDGTSLDKAYVNNGGDTAFFLTPGEKIDAALAALPSGRITIDHAQKWRGVATSGWRGRSFSLGIADSVSVIAKNAADADVAATLIANATNLPDHDLIKREPANQLAPDSDLKDRLVTVAVGLLNAADINLAFNRGYRLAAELISNGKIGGAVLSLQGEHKVAGFDHALLNTPELKLEREPDHA